MTSAFVVTVEDSVAGLAQHERAWDELVAHAAEPNPFYEPQALLPAWRCLTEQAVRVVLVWAPGASPGGSPQLAGLFPIVRRGRYRVLPMPVVSTWQHLYAYLSTPLVRAGMAVEVVDAFFAWLRSQTNAALFECRSLRCDGEFHQALQRSFAQRRLRTFDAGRHTRALFVPAASVDAYLERSLSAKKRKELRRQERRLAELGALHYERSPADLNAWVDEFVALEAEGWKGRAQSALRDDVVAAKMFRECAQAAHARGRWMAFALRLNGSAIAMKCNLLSGDGGVAFKIAFDEHYAQFSPGVLLEIEHLRALHEPGAPAWMDSGAAADHPMIGHLWRERITIGSLVAPTGRAAGVLGIATLPALRWAARAGRRLWGGTS